MEITKVAYSFMMFYNSGVSVLPQLADFTNFRQDLKDGRFSGSAGYRHIHVYTHDKIQHGKSLEIGVVSMATADIFDDRKRKTLSPLEIKPGRNIQEYVDQRFVSV